MVKDIKSYILNKLFFPKVAVIDRPGIIISKTSSRYGNKESKKRHIWFFEDVLVNLQLETIKELGMEKTQEMYYKLAKKQTVRYMLLANVKKPPYFLLLPILNYIMEVYRSAGASLTEKVDYDSKKRVLILEGKDNIFCRKSKVSEYFAGGISITLSFLTGQNIEAKSNCGKCPKQCRIVADPKFKRRFMPDYEKLRPSKRYNELNFPEIMNIPENMKSFSDLMNFKKIWIDNLGKHYFKNKTIAPAEIGWINMIAEHYEGINREDILKKGIVNGAKKVAKDILKDSSPIKEKINSIISMLAAFGWGFPSYKKEGNKIIFRLTYAPFSKYNPLYQAYVINGYVNYIFNKEFELEEIKTKIKPFTVYMIYQSNNSN